MFFETIVAGDEILGYACDMETKMLSSGWHTMFFAWSRKSLQSNPKQKWFSLGFTTMKVWCTMDLYQLDKLLIPLYVKVLKKTGGGNAMKTPCQMTRRMFPASRQWFLPHFDCYADMPRRKVYSIPPPASLYWLDSAPSHFWIFPKIKMGLKGKCFDIVEDTKTNATAELWKILKQDFHHFSSNVRSGVASVCVLTESVWKAIN